MEIRTNGKTVTTAQAMQMLQIDPVTKRQGNRKEWGNPEYDKDGKPLYTEPEYARFKMNVNWKNPKNLSDTISYKPYYSWDYDNRSGITNERKALNLLWKYLMIEKKGRWNWATIFMNLSNDLKVKSRKYNWELAHYVNGEQVRRQGIKFMPFASHIEGCENIKVDIEFTVNNYFPNHIGR